MFECWSADLKVSLDALVTVLPRDKLLALAGPGLPALPGAAQAPGWQTGARAAQGEVPALFCACVTPEAGQPRPAGALTRPGLALTSLGALGVTSTRDTGLASAQAGVQIIQTIRSRSQVIVSLALLTVGPVPAMEE